MSFSHPRRHHLYWIVFFGAGLFHFAAFLLMLAGVDPFFRFFYSFAWWSYILAVASFNHLRGRNSPIFSSTRKDFLLLFLASNLTWLVFEVFNFRLNNWHYTGVPLEDWIRWPGIFVAFGTVFPGLFETAMLFKNLQLPGKVTARPVSISDRNRRRVAMLGILMLLLPVCWPRLFFPLVWLGFILLVDPLLYRVAPEHSIIRRMSRGEYSLLAHLLLAGFACGILWEFWNYWAGAKWSYTIPYLGFGKVFEMPFLGYFGFPPFAVECYLIYHLLRWITGKAGAAGWMGVLTLLLVALLFTVVSIAGIDYYTVEQLQPVF